MEIQSSHSTPGMSRGRLASRHAPTEGAHHAGLPAGLPLDPPADRLAHMSRPAAFVTTRLPVLYTIHPIVRSPGIPTLTTLDLAVVPAGIPTFLATYTIPEDQLDGVVASLQAGDVRVAVTGVGDASGGQPTAFVSVVCADGRRLAVARLRGAEGQPAPEFAEAVRDRVTAGRPINLGGETGLQGEG